MIKNLPANSGDTGSIPGSEDPLEKGMETHYSILAWENPRTEPGRLQLQRAGHDNTHMHALTQAETFTFTNISDSLQNHFDKETISFL